MLPHEAELALSNARAELAHACQVLREFAPPDDAHHLGLWQHQVRKLRMAIGIASNVRDLVVNDVRFDVLQRRRS